MLVLLLSFSPAGLQIYAQHGLIIAVVAVLLLLLVSPAGAKSMPGTGS